MEGKVRYVVRTSGNTKIQPKTINIDGSDDPFYRYKMRELYTQVVGKGKMIKTVLLNVDDVAKDLKIPPAYMTAYLGYELNAQTKYDAKKPDRERASISGDIDADKMSAKIVSFIQEFVLCPKCKLPETTLSVDKKTSDINAACRSCGERSVLKLRDNFTRFILNHPHHFTVAKEEKAVRKKQEAAAKEAAAQQSEHEKQEQNNAAREEARERRRKAKQEEIDDDDGVEWSADFSQEAVKARRKELLPAKLAALVVTDPSEAAEEKPDFIETIRKAVANNPKDAANEAKRLKKELALDEQTFFKLYVEALFDTKPTDVTKEKVALLKGIVGGASTQVLLLEAFEALAKKNEEVAKKVLSFVKLGYEIDVLEEDSILKWYRSPGDATIHGSVKKMVDWLESADEEDD